MARALPLVLVVGLTAVGTDFVAPPAGHPVRAATGMAADDQAPFPVTIDVDAARPIGALRHVWRFFGADEPNYATMKDGQKLLADFGALRPGEVYFRAHNLLTSGDGTPALKWGSTDAYREDAEGRPVYDWKILDGIFDSYLERRPRPPHRCRHGLAPSRRRRAGTGRSS